MQSFENTTERIPKVIEELREIFEQNANKRICVVGSSCVGKSTLLKYFPEAIDMDDLLFGNEEKQLMPLLTQEEIDYACGPWNAEVGEFMDRKSKELIQIQPGHPVFGTIVFPSDLVVEISLPDDILRERVRMRNANERDVLNMKKMIEDEIEKSGIPKVVIENE